MRVFDPSELKNLQKRSQEPENGEVTIVGGSDLFHGAPILSLRVASRIVDMVYFASPEPSLGKVAEHLKSQLSSFIWVPWDEVGDYIAKSDAVLIGPGMKRWHNEKEPPKEGDNAFDEAGTQTRFITQKFLRQFPDKQWVIDGGVLQVMEASWIPKDAILTPNQKEYELLFGDKEFSQVAREYNCILVCKGPATTVCSPKKCVEVQGGNPGLTKGGTGDVLAGITVGLAAKNDVFLAAAAASWVAKRAGDELQERVGTVYNADDLAEKVPEVLGRYI